MAQKAFRDCVQCYYWEHVDEQRCAECLKASEQPEEATADDTTDEEEIINETE